MRLSAAIRLPIYLMVGCWRMALLRRLSPSQNLITMRTSGAGLTLLESQLQRLPDIEQTVIFGNQLYITSRDEAKLKSALFAFTQQGYGVL